MRLGGGANYSGVGTGQTMGLVLVIDDDVMKRSFVVNTGIVRVVKLRRLMVARMGRQNF